MFNGSLTYNQLLMTIRESPCSPDPMMTWLWKKLWPCPTRPCVVSSAANPRVRVELATFYAPEFPWYPLGDYHEIPIGITRWREGNRFQNIEIDFHGLAISWGYPIFLVFHMAFQYTYWLPKKGFWILANPVYQRGPRPFNSWGFWTAHSRWSTSIQNR